jgi:hypothetical protein
MARARNIKPGFFTNDRLVDLSFETRLLFIGLWTLADREGRLEDRPKKIKMELFPADSIEVDEKLSELEKSGFIRRYTVKELKCIQVVNWSKHQAPHHTERASTVPCMDEHGSLTVNSRNDLRGNPPDSLIPDSLIHEEDMAKTGAADLSPSSQPADANGVQTSQPKDECPHSDVIAMFHEVLPSVRRVRDWTPARAQLLRTRWREDAKRQSLDWWRKFFTYVGESDFLMGRTSSERRKPFELGLEWLLKAENFAKVREGAYHEQDGDGK